MKITEKFRSLKKKESKKTEKSIVFIPTGELIPNPNNSRRDSESLRMEGLIDSIQKFGILCPLIIRKRDVVPYIEVGGEKVFAERYEIISGERRWRGAMMLNLDKVPCIIYDVGENVALELFLSENINRENLHFLEETDGADKLISNFGASGEKAAEAISVTKPCLANRFKILSLTRGEQNIIIRNKLSERHATAFVRIEDREKRFRLIEQAVATSMSAPEAERAAEEIVNPVYKTKGDMNRKIAVISDVGFFLNSLNRAIGILEASGIRVDKSELESSDTLEINIKIKRKSKR